MNQPNTFSLPRLTKLLIVSLIALTTSSAAMHHQNQLYPQAAPAYHPAYQNPRQDQEFAIPAVLASWISSDDLAGCALRVTLATEDIDAQLAFLTQALVPYPAVCQMPIHLVWQGALSNSQLRWARDLFPVITALSLRSTPLITYDDGEKLGFALQADGLRYLNLGEAPLTPEAFRGAQERLASCAQLETLILEAMPSDTEPLDGLIYALSPGNLSNLRTLSLAGSPLDNTLALSPDLWRSLGLHSHLTHLNLSTTQLPTNSLLTYLGNLKQLQELDLGYNVLTDDGPALPAAHSYATVAPTQILWRTLAFLENLKVLTLSGNPLSGAFFKVISGEFSLGSHPCFRNLQVLRASDLGDEAFAALWNMFTQRLALPGFYQNLASPIFPALNDLNLAGSPYGGEALTPWDPQSLPHLTTLNLRDRAVPISLWAPVTSLQHVTLGQHIDESEAFEALKTLSTLDSLTLHDASPALDALISLGSTFKQLNCATLTKPNTLATLKTWFPFIPKLKDLRTLNLEGFRLDMTLPEALPGTAATLFFNTLINRLTLLRHLNLSTTLLRNLEGLETLKALTTLDVSFNAVTSLSPLEALTNLTTLNLAFCRGLEVLKPSVTHDPQGESESATYHGLACQHPFLERQVNTAQEFSAALAGGPGSGGSETDEYQAAHIQATRQALNTHLRFLSPLINLRHLDLRGNTALLGCPCDVGVGDAIVAPLLELQALETLDMRFNDLGDQLAMIHTLTSLDRQIIITAHVYQHQPLIASLQQPDKEIQNPQGHNPLFGLRPKPTVSVKFFR